MPDCSALSSFATSLKIARICRSGKYEIPLIIYDRLFDRDGQLNYPVSPDPKSPWVPEVYGDAVLVNGKLFPYLEVEPRKYRFRMLNASEWTVLSFDLNSGQMSWFPKFHQIGTDQGLLPAPVTLKSVRLAPAERADLIFDFSAYSGSNIILRNDNLNAMQFRVAAKGPPDDSALPPSLRPVPKIRNLPRSKLGC